MILRSRGRIEAIRQTVKVNGSNYPHLWCSEINLGSHSGLSEAFFDVPQLLFDELENDLRDARVEVEIQGQGTAFAGYLSVETGELSPAEDRVRLKAYTITKWLEKYHVGQATDQWEVAFWVRNPETKVPTGWTPALILYYLFSWLPAEYQDVIKLGDIDVLHTYEEVGTPDVTFRLCSYAEAITQLMAYVGDVAFRERFERGVVFLDFYRVNEPKAQAVVARCGEWNSPRVGTNVQSITRTDDGTEVVNRIQGFGAYRQHMITCKSALVSLPVQSELELARQLVPNWDGRLENLVMKCPELTRGTMYSAKVLPLMPGFGDTAFELDIDINEIPVGALLRVESSGGDEEDPGEESGEIMRCVAYDPIGGGTEESPLPPVVTVERAVLGTTMKEVKAGDVLTINVPGIEKVFREYRLPKVLDGLPIMQDSCLTDSDGEPYPQFQAFVYRANPVYRKQLLPEPKEWIEGVVELTPTLVDDVKLDVARRLVTFGQPTLTLLSRDPAKDPADTDGKKVEYQRTVCGISLTIENRERPFGWDTGPVYGQTGLDFTTHGLTERWQKNEYEFKALGTGGLTVRGLNWPCYWFVTKERTDPLTGEVLDPVNEFKSLLPEETVVVQDDTLRIQMQCAQMLMEYNRRARSFEIDIPHYSPGYRVGAGLVVTGLKDFPKDQFVITGVRHELGSDQRHRTLVTIDNIKPPARHNTRSV